VKVNGGTAIVTVVGPLNNPSGGTIADMGFLTNGTLLGWAPGGSGYATINLATGQVTLITSPQVVQNAGLAVAPTSIIAGLNIYPAGSVFSLTSNSQAPNAHLNLFNTSTNTESNILNLTGAPCCTFSSLEISSTGTIFALAAGSLVRIPPPGAVVTLGAVAAGVDALSFAPIPAISVSVIPPSVTLGPGQGQIFAASVANTPNTAVTWSIPGGSPGSINATTGAYIAPATVASSQTITVTATSQADGTTTGTATILLVPFVSPVPVPPTVWLAALGLIMTAAVARYRLFRRA